MRQQPKSDGNGQKRCKTRVFAKKFAKPVSIPGGAVWVLFPHCGGEFLSFMGAVWCKKEMLEPVSMWSNGGNVRRVDSPRRRLAEKRLAAIRKRRSFGVQK
jgi:hypothetical protein